MKKNYNIKFNLPKLKDEQIARHKDFDALLKRFEEEKRKPKVLTLKRMRWIMAAAAILVVGFFAIQLFVPKSINEISTHRATPFINPPLEKFQKAFITFEIDAAKGGAFEYGDGTKIIVPPYAFVDIDGKMVVGKVLLKYREFHDYVDIFLSGIPMRYDSASLALDMATAGMMEMYAQRKKNKETVQLKKNIRIELVTKKQITEIDNYNVYQLDTIDRKWEYQTEDKVDIRLDKTTEERLRIILKETRVVQQLTAVQAELDNLKNKKVVELKKIEETIPEPEEPTEPNQPDPNNVAFELDGLDPKEYPQLANYTDVLWEVTSDQMANYEIAISGIEWEDIDIQPISNTYNYRLTLTKGERTLELVIRSALQGNDYSRAKADYENKLRVYEEQKTKRATQLTPQKQALERELLAETEKLTLQKATYQKRYQQERLIQLRKLQKDSVKISKQAIVNRFDIKKLGIWNCDQPKRLAKRTIKATFANENGQPYIKYAAYLVDKRTKSVQRFYTGKNMKFSYNPNTDNLLWLITKGGKIAVFKPADFKKIAKNTDSYTFKLKTIQANLDSEIAIRKILEF